MKKRIIEIDLGGIIYKTTNLLTGLIYVGQHKFPLKNGYLGSGKDFRKSIDDAMEIAKARGVYWRMYFIFEVIEVCHDLKKVDERESYWIEILDATNPKIGYNIAKGGRGHYKCNTSKPVNKYDLNDNFIKKYDSIAEAASNTGIPSYTISRCCHLLTHTKSYKFRLECDNRPLKPFKPIESKSKPIIVTDLLNNFIAEYSSIEETAIGLNLRIYEILRCCNHKQKTVFGYITRYKDDESIFEERYVKSKKHKNKFKSKPVIATDIYDNFIAEYNSIGEAANILGIAYNVISRCCLGKQTYTHNYKFRFKDDNSQIFKYKKKSSSKPINVLNINNNAIERYESMREASLKLGISSGTISGICSGGYISKKHNIYIQF